MCGWFLSSSTAVLERAMGWGTWPCPALPAVLRPGLLCRVKQAEGRVPCQCSLHSPAVTARGLFHVCPNPGRCLSLGLGAEEYGAALSSEGRWVETVRPREGDWLVQGHLAKQKHQMSQVGDAPKTQA